MQVWATCRQRAFITPPLLALRSPEMGSKLSGEKSLPDFSSFPICSKQPSISARVSSGRSLYFSSILWQMSSLGRSLYMAIMS